MIWVFSGDRPSNGAKELGKLPGFKRLRTGKFIKPGDMIINWGTTNLNGINAGMVLGSVFLNDNVSVQSASNKLTAFKKMTAAEVQTVPWCAPTDDETLKLWQQADYTIVGRQTLTGHSGAGIIIMMPDDPIQPALLYTKYIYKEHEFRVHVVNGKVIDTQKKIKDPDREVITWKVRSHANGFIFARNNVNVSYGRDALAVAAVASLGLDFGAVDIVEDKKGQFYVLEINTAPGLEGQTITNYGDAFSAIASQA